MNNRHPQESKEIDQALKPQLKFNTDMLLKAFAEFNNSHNKWTAGSHIFWNNRSKEASDAREEAAPRATTKPSK